MLYFDSYTLPKNWGRWSDTVGVRLPDIDFNVWVRLQNMLSVKRDKEEILVGKIIYGDKKLEDSVLRKVLANSDDSYLSRSIWKSPNKNICIKDYFQSLCNNREI